MSELTTPDYNRLKNFWQAKSDTTTLPTNNNNNNSNNNNNNSTGKKFSTSGSNNSVPIVNNDDSTTTPNKLIQPQKEYHHHRQEEEDDNNLIMDGPASFLEYDQDIVSGNLAEFLQLSRKLGGEIAQHADLVAYAFKAQKEFLQYATRFEQPSETEFQRLLSSTGNAINEIQKFRESRRSSSFFNHLSAISESIPALAWVTISPTPGPYVKEMNDAGQFYTNRVLKDFKEKSDGGEHINWVKSWVGLLTALQTYVRKHHTTGLVWGKTKGGSVGGGGGPPMPPPPPPMDFADDFQAVGGGDDEGRAALFEQLNQGEDITSRLKKVTVKGPGGREMPMSKGKAQQNNASQPQTAKQPVFKQDGKKWIIEHQMNQKNMKIEDAQMNNVVYMFGCKDTVLTVTGKLNSIVVDSCVKSAVIFDSLVASVEYVNCRDCQMQVMGTVPTITIDKTDGLQMYLSKDSMNVEIVSAKSSALNVMVPKNEDYVEWPIPEQYKTKIGTNGLVTTPSENVGV